MRNVVPCCLSDTFHREIFFSLTLLRVNLSVGRTHGGKERCLRSWRLVTDAAKLSLY